jgi:hypothetical protein
MTKRSTGAASAKRELCAELDVNPYSTNELLQQELDRVAGVLAAGKMTGKIALMAVGGGAGTAISGLSTVDTTSRMVYDLSPAPGTGSPKLPSPGQAPQWSPELISD